MQKLLLIVLAAVGAVWIGYKIGDATAVCFKAERVSTEGPKQGVSLKDAGALNDGGSCDLSWAYCWRRT